MSNNRREITDLLVSWGFTLKSPGQTSLEGRRVYSTGSETVTLTEHGHESDPDNYRKTWVTFPDRALYELQDFLPEDKLQRLRQLGVEIYGYTEIVAMLEKYLGGRRVH